MIRAGQRLGGRLPGCWVRLAGAMSRDAVALKMRAFAVALSVKADTLDPRDLEALRRHASAERPARPVAQAVLGFCRQVIEARADRPRQVALADGLLTFIDLDNLPVVPGQNRRDLNG